MASSFPPTWVEVNLHVIEQNVRNLCRMSNVPLMAIVKANGHGHGAIEVSISALAGGATWLGVARVAEGVALMKANIQAPVLVLGPVTLAEVDEAIAHGLVLTLYGSEVGEMYVQRCQALGRSLSVHVKVDTGMGRLGVLPDDVFGLVRRFAQREGLCIEGLFTHLAQADEFDLVHTKTQMSRFQIALQAMQATGIHPTWVHVANSAAVLFDLDIRFSMVRVGAAIYGLPPSAKVCLPPQLCPALSWKASLASCKLLPAGWGVGYGHEYVNQNPELIGVLPVGYADGWRRSSGNNVLIAGQRAPIVGLVCMDLCMVRLPGHVSPGTEVVLLGKQGGESVTAQEIAARWKTSSLDVVSAISARVPRFYINHDAPE